MLKTIFTFLTFGLELSDDFDGTMLSPTKTTLQGETGRPTFASSEVRSWKTAFGLQLTVVRFTVLRVTVLRFTVLRFTVLCFTVLRFTVLRFTVVPFCSGFSLLHISSGFLDDKTKKGKPTNAMNSNATNYSRKTIWWRPFVGKGEGAAALPTP